MSCQDAGGNARACSEVVRQSWGAVLSTESRGSRQPVSRERSRRRVSDRPAAPGLSEESIVQAACDIILASGTDGLTVRALSDRLGVALGATYHHIANRQALLTLVARELFSRIDLPNAEADDWRESLRCLLIDIVDVFKQHSGMVAFHVNQRDESHAQEIGLRVRAILANAGFDPKSAQVVMAAMFFYLNGVLMQTPALQQAAIPEPTRRQGFLAGLDLLLDGAQVMLCTDLENRARSVSVAGH